MVVWEKYCAEAIEWDRLVATLGGSFYQTYHWGLVRSTANWLPLRLVAKRAGLIIAVASVLVKRKFGVAVCWIPGGPSGDLGALNVDFEKTLRQELRTNIFYCRLSLLHVVSAEHTAALRARSWGRPSSNISSKLTLYYSLLESESDRLKKMTANWRHNLKRAGRHDLRIEQCISPSAIEISELYREMERLKGLPIQHGEQELAAIFQYCNDKIVVYRCTDKNGNLLAIRAAALFGDKAIDFLAAAGQAARKLYATHATLWALLNHCSDLGISTYDLGGVDPVNNRGVYDFKHGTGAVLTEYVGEWERANLLLLPSLVNWALKANISVGR